MTSRGVHDHSRPDKSDSSDEFELIEASDAALEGSSLARILKWLQPTDFGADSSEYNRHLSSQAPGTGLWICQTDNYREWHDSADHASLWVKGAPGAGKSVTAASIAKHLSLSESVPVLTFFFRYIVVANRTPLQLVRDWLAQLLSFSVKLQHDLQVFIEHELDDFSEQQLWDLLLSSLSNMEKVYCVVDALDEMDMEAENGFLDRLNKLATFQPRTVKILMTSRPKQYLQRALPETSIVHISLERDLVGLDIAQFVTNRLQICLPGHELEAYREEVATTILTRCDGLFLYARLLIDQITPAISLDNLPSASQLVSSIPTGLESMYNSMLNHQASALGIDQEIQEFLLEMTTHCARPLRLNELSHALNCQFPQIGLGDAKRLARLACSPLLEVLEDETVQVIHHSLTEFLLNGDREEQPSQSSEKSFPVLVPGNAHKKLSLLCLRYLQFGLTNLSPRARKLNVSGKQRDDLATRRNRGYEEDSFDFDHQEARLEYTLLDYAVRQWAHHASRYDCDDESFFKAVTDFLQPKNEACIRWMRMQWDTRKSRTQIPSVLHIAAFAGLTCLARTLDIPSMVNLRDGDDRTPLHWASGKGRTSFAKLLLDHEANVAATDCNGLQPVHEAAKQDHADVMELLLQAGANPVVGKSRENHGVSGHMCGTILTKGENPLQYAIARGHTKTVAAMIPFLDQEGLSEALVRSCKSGRTEMVRRLLEQSAVSPDGRFRDGLPLVFAIRSLDAMSVELLIKRGADVNDFSAYQPPRKHGCGGPPRREVSHTPIHALMRAWRPSKIEVCRIIFKLLVDAGADLNMKNGHGDTPLVDLCTDDSNDHKQPHRAAVRTLLEAGATFVDEKNDSLICRYLQRSARDVRVLQDLIEFGARTDTIALHVAMRKRSWGSSSWDDAERSNPPERSDPMEEAVHLLMQQGARLEAKDENGVTALEVAAEFWTKDFEFFKSLFESCSDLTAKERCIWSIGRGNPKGDGLQRFVGLFHDAGISIEVRNQKGQTPLLANFNRPKALEALISAGADIHVTDNKGHGILATHILHHSDASEIRKWASRGLSITVADRDGNTLLHILAEKWKSQPPQVGLLSYLLEQGLGPNATNKRGDAMLHAYLNSPKDLNARSRHFVNGREIGAEVGTVSAQRLSGLIEISKLHGIDLDARDGNGRTPLHITASKDPNEFAFLLDAGADLSRFDHNGKHALHIAAETGQANIVGQILDITASEMINAVDDEQRTAVHLACTHGYLELVDILIRRGADLTVKDRKGQTPLHTCSNSTDEVMLPSLVQLLINGGADTRALDSSGFTPLDRAIRTGCKSMVIALTRDAADSALLSNLPDLFEGRHVSRRQKVNDLERRSEFATLSSLLSRAEPSIEHLPAHAQSEIVQDPSKYVKHLREHDMSFLLSTGAGSLSCVNGSFDSKFLQEIAASGRIDLMGHLAELTKPFDDRELVQTTLAAHPGTGSRYDYDYDPLVVAACKRNVPNILMLELLIESHGLDPNAPTSDGRAPAVVPPGRTPLHILAEARSWWQLDGLRYLASRGADIHARDDREMTPLHVASDELVNWNGHARTDGNRNQNLWKHDSVRILLDLGADINALDGKGQSPLHFAAMSPKTMRTLLERGADWTIGSSSPIFSAIAQQNVETLRILLDAGCDPNSIDTGEIVVIDYKREKQTRHALFCVCFCRDLNQQAEDNVALMLLLLERGANLYSRLAKDETLGHYIVEFAEYSIAACLVDNLQYIDLDRRDRLGRTILHAACRSSTAEPRRQDVDRESSSKSVLVKLMSYSPKLDLSAVDDDGKTMLHHLLDNVDASDNLVLEVLRHPISLKLIGLKDKGGYTAMHYALKSLRLVLVEALLSMGADLLAPDPTGATALHHISRRNMRTVKQRHESLHNDDDDESSDFYLTCLKLWQKCRAQGGDIESRDNDGNTPLMYYCAAPRIELTYAQQQKNSTVGRTCHLDNYDRYFADADVFARNKIGQSVLHVIANREKVEHYYEKGTAAQSDHDAHLFEFMVKKGLDPLDEDHEGRTALDYAAVREQKSILELYRYKS